MPSSKVNKYRKNRRSKTRKGGADYCNVLNKNRIDLFKNGTTGVTEKMCNEKKGCWGPPTNCSENCSKIPWCYTSQINIVVDLRGWTYPMNIRHNSTPNEVLAKLWALLRLKAMPKIMPNGSRRWSGCDAYCPPEEDKPKYVIKTIDGEILDNSKTLAENNVTDSDTLIATMP